MALETGTYINNLNANNPASTDEYSTTVGHLQLIKKTIQNTFPNLIGTVHAANNDLTNSAYYVDSSVTANQITLTFNPALTAYTSGMGVIFKLANTNTSTVYVNINGLGNIQVMNTNGGQLFGYELVAGNIYRMTYNGSTFNLSADYGTFVTPYLTLSPQYGTNSIIRNTSTGALYLQTNSLNNITCASNGSVSLYSNLTVPGTLTVSGAASIATPTVSGTATFNGASTFNGNVTNTALTYLTGSGFSGSWINSNGDAYIIRNSAPTTGYLELGNSGGKYIYMDGTNLNIVGTNVNAPSLVVSGGSNLAGGAVTTTQTRGDNSPSVATTAFVKSLIGVTVGASTPTCSHSGNGYEIFPSGFMMICGQSSTSSTNQMFTVNFLSQCGAYFPSSCVYVQVARLTNNGASGE